MRHGRAFALARTYGCLAGLGLLLLGLRLLVFSQDVAGLKTGSLGAMAREDPWAIFKLFQLLIQSLSFEVGLVIGLAALARRGLWERAVARVVLGAALVLNVAAAKLFVTLRTYVRGFQLVGLPWGETWAMVGSHATLPVWGGLLIATALAARFAAPGTFEGGVRPPREKVGWALLALLCAISVAQLLWQPSRVPTLGHSPVTLLLARAVPLSPAGLPRGEASPEDWEKVFALAPAWQPLSQVPRDFSVLIVVLESVRADAFWPSGTAVASRAFERRRAHAAAFTQAYAHEPLSIKGLEALLFGIYPAPFWETAASVEGALALPTLAERWRALGLTTAFISHGTVPYIGEPAFLRARGFDVVTEGADLTALDAVPTDRTLVRAFEKLLERVGAGRFGAFVWPMHTHLPYALPTPPGNRAPLNTEAAYREAVAYLDEVLDALFGVLEGHGRADDTVVILVGDHGESFGEHAEVGAAHGDWLYQQTTHVPLVFSNPRLFHGERDGRVVQQKDVAATAAWLAGEADPNFNQGRSVFHARRSEAAYLVSHLDVASLRGALVADNLKYLFVQGVEGRRHEEHLFDLAVDPLERNDLLPSQPERSGPLRARYFGWLRHHLGLWMEIEADGRWNDAAHLEAVGLGTPRNAGATTGLGVTKPP
jgi:hypothetical protein